MGTRVERREVMISVQAESGPPATPIVSARPAYEADTWIQLGGPAGGLGYDIRMDPTNPEVMFVTDAFAGIMKSTDGGLNWTPVNNGIAPLTGPVYRIFSATIDPHDHNTIWIGTQDTGHIYRSTDGGETWALRDTGLLTTDGIRSVRGLTIDPNDPNVVYAGVEVQLLTWSDGTSGFQPRRMGMPTGGEVYKSLDAGASWTRIWQGDSLARYIWVDPRNSDRLYVSTGIFDRDAANSDIPNGIWGGVGILRSDDGGQTWTVLDDRHGLGGLYIPSLFMHPLEPDTLVAAVTTPADPGGAGVYVTHDGGDTWQQILQRPGALSMDAVEISTADPQVWYAATEGSLFRSDDAGATWKQFFMGSAERKSGMPIDLQADPRDPYRLFVNNYGGGNFVSQDGGETWTDASAGYSGALVASLAVAPGSGTTVFAGADTATFRSDDGGRSWQGTAITSAPALLILPDEDSSHYVLLATTSEQGNIAFGRDDGQTWSQANVSPIGPTPYGMRALAVAASDPKVMFTGFMTGNCPGMVELPLLLDCDQNAPGLFRSLDGGMTWTELTGAPFEDALIEAIAIHPSDSNVVYVATAVGLYRSPDGGESWQELQALEAVAMDSLGPGPHDFTPRDAIVVLDVALDPAEPRTVYAAAWPGILLRSRDAGLSWSQVIRGLQPADIVFDILPDPHRTGVMYIGTAFSGVLYTIDGGESWLPTGNGTCHTNLRSLALSEDGSVLYAGTRRAGVWRLGTANVSQP